MSCGNLTKIGAVSGCLVEFTAILNISSIVPYANCITPQLQITLAFFFANRLKPCLLFRLDCAQFPKFWRFVNDWRKGMDILQSIQDLGILGDIVCWRDLLKAVTWLVTVDELRLPGWRQVVEKDVVSKCVVQVCFVVGISNHESLDIKK